MATASLNPKSKRSKTRAARAQVRARHVAAEKADKKARRKPLRDLFAERDRAVMRGEYEVLGRVLMMQLERGMVDYFKNGPTLARIPGTNTLLLLDGWQRFPSTLEMLPDLCDECRVTCTDCEGSGERLCMYVGCGGEGQIILSRKACDAKGCAAWTGRARPNCKKCGGGGLVVGETKECPCCKGTKKQECPRCMGSGQMTTGRDGENKCAKCHGLGRKLKITEQPWQQHELGELEGYTVVGPIVAMQVLSDVMRDPERGVETIEFRPDENGNLGALLFKGNPSAGRTVPQYVFGGEAVIPPAKEVSVM